MDRVVEECNEMEDENKMDGVNIVEVLSEVVDNYVYMPDVDGVDDDAMHRVKVGDSAVRKDYCGIRVGR